MRLHCHSFLVNTKTRIVRYLSTICPVKNRCDRVLDGVLKKNKAEGVEKLVEPKEAIRKADMERLDDYFRNVLTEGDAIKLTQYCWLNIMLHFALRGSEVQIQLKKSNIKFEKGWKR